MKPSRMQITWYVIVLCGLVTVITAETNSYSYSLAGGAGHSRFTSFTGSLQREPKTPKKVKVTQGPSVKPPPTLPRRKPFSSKLPTKKPIELPPTPYKVDFERVTTRRPISIQPSKLTQSVKSSSETSHRIGVSQKKSQSTIPRPSALPISHPILPPISRPAVIQAISLQSQQDALRIPQHNKGHITVGTGEQDAIAKQILGLQSFGKFSNGDKDEVTSSLHVHVAPDMPSPAPVVIKATKPQPRKHYNVVLVKTPSSPPPQILLPRLDISNKEKTLIYVLQENPKALVAPKLHIEKNSESKPEVFLLKYDSSSATSNLGY